MFEFSFGGTVGMLGIDPCPEGCASRAEQLWQYIQEPEEDPPCGLKSG